jgi:hypothetical protein
MGPGIFLSLTVLTWAAILDIGQLDFAGQTHCNNSLGLLNQVTQFNPNSAQRAENRLAFRAA